MESEGFEKIDVKNKNEKLTKSTCTAKNKKKKILKSFWTKLAIISKNAFKIPFLQVKSDFKK